MKLFIKLGQILLSLIKYQETGLLNRNVIMNTLKILSILTCFILPLSCFADSELGPIQHPIGAGFVEGNPEMRERARQRFDNLRKRRAIEVGLEINATWEEINNRIHQLGVLKRQEEEDININDESRHQERENEETLPNSLPQSNERGRPR